MLQKAWKSESLVRQAEAPEVAKWLSFYTLVSQDCGSRWTVFFGEASSQSRLRSVDSYTLQSVIWSRPHGISMISWLKMSGTFAFLSRWTVVLIEAASQSRHWSDDSYTLQSVILSRPHWISMVSWCKFRPREHWAQEAPAEGLVKASKGLLKATKGLLKAASGPRRATKRLLKATRRLLKATQGLLKG